MVKLERRRTAETASDRGQPRGMHTALDPTKIKRGLEEQPQLAECTLSKEVEVSRQQVDEVALQATAIHLLAVV